LARISGIGAEKLFNRFARDFVINYSLDSSPNKQLNFVQTLDSLLSTRLRDGIYYGDQPFTAGDEWLSEIQANRLPPALRNAELASQWTAFLSDRVLAMDSIIRINNNSGKAVIIGVDITVNPQPKNLEEKLAKIRGLKTNPNKESNDNKGIPKVRQALGIDKHIVLVLPGDTERFPSFDVMLDRLHAAANEPAQTKLINLAELPLEQTLDWKQHFEQVQPLNLWKFYNNKFAEKEGHLATGSIRDLQKVAALAVSDGVRKEKIVLALQQSPWYKEQAASPRQKERDFAEQTLDQMIEKLIDAKEIQNANQSISIPEQNYQPTRGELLRWHGAAEVAQDLEAKEVSVTLLRQLKSEFQAAGGQEQVPPRDYSNADVVVSEDVRSRMESMVEEYAVRVVPRVEVEVQRDRSENYDIDHDR
jgi:hypothetical protein